MNEKLIKILKTVNALVESNELTSALNDEKFDGEYELSDDAVKAIEKQLGSLMTVEAAIRNEDVKKTLLPLHKKSAFKEVEKNLGELYEFAGIDPSKYDMVSDGIEDLKKAILAAPKPKAPEAVQSLEEDKRKLAQELEKIKASYEDKIIKQQSEFESQRLKDAFIREATKKQWASAYEDPDARDGIIERKWSKLQQIAKPKLTESGIKLFDKEMPDKGYYDGNKEVTFQNFLDREFDPYLRKSAPANPAPSANPIISESRNIQLTPMQESARRAAERVG